MIKKKKAWEIGAAMHLGSLVTQSYKRWLKIDGDKHSYSVNVAVASALDSDNDLRRVQE